MAEMADVDAPGRTLVDRRTSKRLKNEGNGVCVEDAGTRRECTMIPICYIG